MRSGNLGDVDMSKNFEEEYKEYLNAQAPDLWDRIEAGVDASVAADFSAENTTAEKVVPISGNKSRKAKKKRQIRYQHYRAIVSVAACLFALIIIVPVYMLTRPTGKDNASADSAAPQMLEDVTIQNIVADSEESYDTIEESAPMEDTAGGVTEVEIALEETAEEMTELAQVTEESSDGTAAEESATVAEDSENGGQVAQSPDVTDKSDIMAETEEESVAAEEDMTVTILGGGAMQEGGVMYTAAVVGSASSATISIFVPTESAIVLEADKVYNVTAELSEDGAYYVAVSVTAAE